jgi:hypothetical protein
MSKNNLNNIGQGKKLIDEVISQGRAKSMGWTKEQQAALLNRLPNPHNPKSFREKKK